MREELKRIAKGEYKPPSSEKTKHGSITFAAINLPVTQVHNLLEKVTNKILQVPLKCLSFHIGDDLYTNR